MLAPKVSRAGRFVVLAALGILVAGCGRLTPRLERGMLPEGTPGVETILADLAENDARIRSFRERQALLTMKSPKLKATQTVSADVAFERPDKLYIVGRQRASRGVIFRIRSVGSEYLVQVPSENAVYSSRSDQPLEGVPFSVSPSDIARELFLPEDWSELNRRDVQLEAFDPSTQTATLLIGPRRRPDRRVQVAGPPWHVVVNERLDDDGVVIARTVRSDYREWDGIRFPQKIEATFPAQETELRLDKIDNPKFNEALEGDLFVIDWNRYTRQLD